DSRSGRAPHYIRADATAAHRPGVVHAAVRPRARLLARAGRRGRGTADLALPLRGPAAARRVRALRDLLPRLQPGLRALARTAAAQGRRAPGRADPHPLATRRDRPPSVAGRAGDRQPRAAHGASFGLHRARSPPAADGEEAGVVDEAPPAVLARR